MDLCDPNSQFQIFILHRNYRPIIVIKYKPLYIYGKALGIHENNDMKWYWWMTCGSDLLQLMFMSNGYWDKLSVQSIENYTFLAYKVVFKKSIYLIQFWYSYTNEPLFIVRIRNEMFFSCKRLFLRFVGWAQEYIDRDKTDRRTGKLRLIQIMILCLSV